MSTPNSTDGLGNAGQPPKASRGLMFKLAALGLIAACALGGTGLARLLKGPPEASPRESAFGLQMPAKYDSVFATWDSAVDTGKRPPDLVLLLSGQEHGYLMPCGCSEPQIGGLERRYNLVRLLKLRGWKVAAVDVGDVPQKEGIQGPVRLPNVQGMLKYVVAMKSRKAMGYSAVGVGEHEAYLTLAETLGNFALNEDRPSVLAANLKDADTNFPGIKGWVEAAEVDSAKGGLPVKVGVAAVVGADTQERIKKLREPRVDFVKSTPALIQVLGEMAKAGVDLRILLYQGPVGGAKAGQQPTGAVGCADFFPHFHALLCASDEDEPPGQPVWVTPSAAPNQKTPVISLGHKAKYVGVLGVWRTGNANPPFVFKYQLVELTPDFRTPNGMENQHPVLEEMERYTTTLEKEDYLRRYGQTKHLLQVMPPAAGVNGMPTYVGSQTCKKCHSAAYGIWKDSKHSHAYQTLVDAKRPSHRQFDGECIVCHTVGFGYEGGFKDATRTPLLKDVGCENCHGPGSLHVAHPKNPQWQQRMNMAWWKNPATFVGGKEPKEVKQRRMAIVDQFCQKCHDIDNDVTWKNTNVGKDKPVFERKWDQVKHYTVPDDE